MSQNQTPWRSWLFSSRLALAFGVAFAVSSARATTYTWQSDTTVSSDWNTAANWSPSGPPPSGTHGILINSLCSETNPVIYSGNLTTLSSASTLATSATDGGYLSIASGTLAFTSSLTIGNSGEGLITVNNGGTLIKNTGTFNLGLNAGSYGAITVLSGGTLNFTNQNFDTVVGSSGKGVLYLPGGLLNMSNTANRRINLGLVTTGTGEGWLLLRGGTVSAAASTAYQVLNVGYNNGVGTGRGTVKGYGTISMLSGSVGYVQVGGDIIGDGTQPDASVANHTLSINYNTLTTASNTSGTTHFGYYTANMGAVKLKDLTASAGAGDLFWGDDQTAPGRYTIGNSLAASTNVTVNSAYLHKTAACQASTVSVSLLDPTRTKQTLETGTLPANRTGLALMNLWQIGSTGGTFTLDKFGVRYDETSGVNGAANYGPISGLLYWDGTSANWTNASASSSVDTANYLVNYSGTVSIPSGNSGFFALAAAPSVDPWGVSMSASSRNSMSAWASPIAQTGLKWTRGFAAFSSIEPTEGTWNWTPVDTQLATAGSNGLSTSAILFLNASWINSNTQTFPTANLPAWSTYVNTLVSHVAGAVKYWEVWNEPPNWSTSGTAGAYAATVCAAYDAAKAADPDCYVGLAAQSNNVNWLDQTLVAGAADHFDYITLHPYEMLGAVIGSPGFESEFMSMVPTVRKMLSARNPARTNAPVWFTEIGAVVGGSAGTVAITANVQAEALVKTYAMGLAQGVSRILWFEGRDGDSGAFGLLTSGGVQRPAYVAMTQLIQYLGSSPLFKGWVMLNGKDYGFVFQGATTTVMAAWTPLGTSDTVDFGATVQVVDPLTGSSINTSSYALTNTPILVVGVPSGILAQAQSNLTQPFPWGGDYTGATSVSLVTGSSNTEAGLHQLYPDATSTAVAIYSGTARYCGPSSAQRFTVDPNVLSYTPKTITITAVVRRDANNDNAGFNLKYEGTSGWKSTGSWYTVPGNGQWYTKTWTLTDPQFVGKWGYNFAFDSDSTTYSKYYLQSVTVTVQ